MMILVSTADFAVDATQGAILCPSISWVSVSPPALPCLMARIHRDSTGQAHALKAGNGVSWMFVSLAATFAIFRELLGGGERSSALQSSTRSN